MSAICFARVPQYLALVATVFKPPECASVPPSDERRPPAHLIACHKIAPLWSRIARWLGFASAFLLLTALGCGAASFAPPKDVGDAGELGRGIQRTLRLLATSTPAHRNTVKVLFYGQSITEQRWSQQVADYLKRQFPNANLIIENRAIGGFASQLLVKTAETDLYPFYPDLLIFHVYGSHLEYENIIRRVRERTTAEILIQTDHITKDDQLGEETDPSKLTPKSWDAFMNHSFLPG